MKKIGFILMLVLAVGCNRQDNISVTNNSISFNEDFAFLIGKWKEVEYRGSNGADFFSKRIKNKQRLTFEKDGSVIIEKNNTKEKGKYEVHSDEGDIKLHISSSKGNFYYLVFKSKGKRIALNPVTSEYGIICDEGCAYVYKKIK